MMAADSAAALDTAVACFVREQASLELGIKSPPSEYNSKTEYIVLNKHYISIIGTVIDGLTHVI